MRTTGAVQNHFKLFGHWLLYFAPGISRKLGNVFRYKYALQAFIYFYEFQNMAVILEVSYKDAGGNGNEWPWVQQFTVLWKEDKNKMRMSDFSRPNLDKSNRKKKTGKGVKWWQFLLKEEERYYRHKCQLTQTAGNGKTTNLGSTKSSSFHLRKQHGVAASHNPMANCRITQENIWGWEMKASSAATHKLQNKVMNVWRTH